MKKFIICISMLVLLSIVGWYAYFVMGIYINFNPNTQPTSFMTTDEDTVYIEKDGEKVPFEIRGVDLGAGIPGEWATDFAIDYDTYQRWFQQIQELGANTIRIYTILHDDFYNAFYDYNLQREADGKEPLYLLHGVWVDDYSHNSHKDMYDDELLPELMEDTKTIIDIIHGKKYLLGRDGDGSGYYRHDISRWVIGYILGVEWESSLVTYTNQTHEDDSSYQGEFLTTTKDASPFEAALAKLGDAVIEYETVRYKQQRLIAFSNWPTTDPFIYSVMTTAYRHKTSIIDVEHIQPTDAFISGYFASYHIYSYFPDYLEIEREAATYTEEELIKAYGEGRYKNTKHRISQLNGADIHDYLDQTDYYDSEGRYNTYYAYLKALNNFHNIPVVISEYGSTTGRGQAQIDKNTGRNQGNINETEQGQALVECYQDIMNAGSAGSCLFSWQDEWFKRTWNTLHMVDMEKRPYWSDYQTNEQFYGLLTFDPGEEKSVCYVDGDRSEWVKEDQVLTSDGMTLSMKYDEKFLYFYVDGFNPMKDVLYIPIDTTPKTGSTYCQNYGLTFERPCDFLIRIDGKNHSRVLVQERYEALMSTYGTTYYAVNPYYKSEQPEVDSPAFRRIYLPLTREDTLPSGEDDVPIGEKYETGKLRYGNGNPASAAFDSLTDFKFTKNGVEIRLPWQLLNFSNPSEMIIHDDYYEHYGIENLQIDELNVGIAIDGHQKSRIRMTAFDLKGWGKKPTYHERLKQSYYIIQDYWEKMDKANSN